MLIDTNGFVAKLDRQHSWRVKEILSLRAELTFLYGPELKPSVLRLPAARAGVCLAYAHWEGFFRACSALYLDLIRTSLSAGDQIISTIRAAALLEFVRRNEGTFGLDMCERFLESSDAQRLAFIEIPKVGKLAGNLSWELFRDTIQMLGFSVPGSIEVKRNFINVALLKRRNDIAHGDGVLVDAPNADEVGQKVLELLAETRALFVENALSESYLA